MMLMWPIFSEVSSDTRERRPCNKASWRGRPPCPPQKSHLALEPHLLLLDARCFLQGWGCPGSQRHNAAPCPRQHLALGPARCRGGGGRSVRERPERRCRCLRPGPAPPTSGSPPAPRRRRPLRVPGRRRGRGGRRRQQRRWRRRWGELAPSAPLLPGSARLPAFPLLPPLLLRPRPTTTTRSCGRPAMRTMGRTSGECPPRPADPGALAAALGAPQCPAGGEGKGAG